MAQFHEKIYQLLKNLLQLSAETKHHILLWLGNCLHANAGRAKIWASQVPEIFLQTYASDSFFLNLGAALLRLCQPFCKPKSARLLTFNPTYCALREINEEERRTWNVHMKGEYNMEAFPLLFHWRYSYLVLFCGDMFNSLAITEKVPH